MYYCLLCRIISAVPTAELEPITDTHQQTDEVYSLNISHTLISLY